VREILARLARFADERGSAAVAALVVLALAFGLAYAVYLGDQAPYIDEVDYLAIATNLATKQFFSGDGQHPNAWRAPVYPLLLGGLVRLGVPTWGLRLLNFTALALAVWLIAAIARRQSTALGGLLAAALIFAYPVLFYAAGRFFPQTLAGLLLVLLVYLMGRARSAFAFAGAGLVYGALVLTVPVFMFHAWVLAGWLLLVHGWTGLRWSLLVMASASLVVAVWVVRNYLVFGVALVTTASGGTLLWGNSPYATIGGADVEFLFRYYAEAAKLGEVESNAYYTAEALRYIRENKLEALGFYLLKVANHFNFYNEHFLSSEGSTLRTLVMLVTYGPLLLLLIVRLLQWRRFPLGPVELLLAVLYVSAAFVYAIFHTRIRYRVPFDYLLLTMVGMYLDRFLRTWLDRDERAAPRSR